MPATQPQRSTRPFRLRCVLFDFDDTLTRPGALDFAAMKRVVGCPPDRLVLEWIGELPAGAQRDTALAALEGFELAGADQAAPNESAEELVRDLHAQGLGTGILTRNGLPAVRRALGRFPELTPDDFDVIVTRDQGLAPKPAADGVLYAAAAMGAAPHETLLVGDCSLDMRAGRAAGAVTALLTNGAGDGAPAPRAATEGPSATTDDQERPDDADCDFVVSRLAELRDVVRLGLPLAPGKLPNDLLAGYLGGVAADDPALLVPPAVGEDVAAFSLDGAEVLVAHGDPITLGGDRPGRAAVLVNANDIAASGAAPRWLLATVLLPPQTTPSEALAVLGDLAAAADAEGIVMAGGHTEVTPAVVRPTISATMLGTLLRKDLRHKKSVHRGDRVVITKELAIEGTVLLAEELGERLHALGMSDAELAACRDLQPQSSIVPEARVAAQSASVHAMHDITEGGLATAIRELAAATGRGVTVHRERIPVAPLCRRVCDLLGADPLGLIASGSLLICCAPEGLEELLAALRAQEIAATELGVFTEEGAGVTALEGGRPAPWPSFAVDEAARLLSAEESRQTGPATAHEDAGRDPAMTGGQR
jgi:HAD superfamily hydrolase (TIGR01509 family)